MWDNDTKGGILSTDRYPRIQYATCRMISWCMSFKCPKYWQILEGTGWTDDLSVLLRIPKKTFQRKWNPKTNKFLPWLQRKLQANRMVQTGCRSSYRSETSRIRFWSGSDQGSLMKRQPLSALSTLPETNSSPPKNRPFFTPPKLKRESNYSNHPFSGTDFVSFRKGNNSFTRLPFYITINLTFKKVMNPISIRGSWKA